MATKLYNKKLPKGKSAASVATKMRGKARGMARGLSGKMSRMK